jgi:hypothetical protein
MKNKEFADRAAKRLADAKATLARLTQTKSTERSNSAPLVCVIGDHSTERENVAIYKIVSKVLQEPK